MVGYRLSVPCVESRIVNSMLFAELLYRDVLRKALSLVQKPKALKIFTAVYHSSHSLNERKGIIFPLHIQDVKIDSLRFYTRTAVSFAPPWADYIVIIVYVVHLQSIYTHYYL